MADEITVETPVSLPSISEVERIAIEEQARQAAVREEEQNRQIEAATKMAAETVSRSDMESLRSYFDERINAIAQQQQTLAEAMDALAEEAIDDVTEETAPTETTVVEETPPPAVSPKKRKRGWI